MNTLQNRIAELNDMIDVIKQHPMCLELQTSKNYYVVVFPWRVRGLDGIRVAIGKSKKAALTKLFDRLELAWIHDNPVLYPDAA